MKKTNLLPKEPKLLPKKPSKLKNGAIALATFIALNGNLSPAQANVNVNNDGDVKKWYVSSKKNKKPSAKKVYKYNKNTRNSSNEKLNHDMAKKINAKLNEMNIDNFDEIKSNILNTILFAYDIDKADIDKKVYIKRWRVPYQFSIWIWNMKEYLGPVWYNLLKIEEHDWKIYLVIKSYYIPKDER